MKQGGFERASEALDAIGRVIEAAQRVCDEIVDEARRERFANDPLERRAEAARATTRAVIEECRVLKEQMSKR